MVYGTRSARCGAVLAIVAVALVVGSSSTALAQGRGGLRKCFGAEITMEEAEMECVKMPGGEWQPVGGGGDVSFDDIEGGSGFGTIVFFAMLISLIPAFAGMTLAPAAGIAPGAGFGIGLFGSWVGVIGLYLYSRGQKAGSAPPGAGPNVGAALAADETSPSRAAERLRTLEELRKEGLITEQEYETRRAATLERL